MGVLRNQAGEGGEGGGGDPPPDAPKFTQKDFETALGKRLNEERRKYADYDDLKKQVGELSTLKQKLEELETEKAKAGKTAEEIQRMEAEKAARQLQRERDEYTAKMSAAEKRAIEAENMLRNERIERALGAGLDSAKVLSSAREDAVMLFRSAAKVEFDDDGKLASVQYGGLTYKTAAEAAAAFLKDKDHLASAGRPAGGGSQRPTGGGTNGRPLHEMSPDELLALAAQGRR